MTGSKTVNAVRTSDGLVLIEQPDGSYRKAEDRTDWERLARITDEEIEKAAQADPDAPPMTEAVEWWERRLVTKKAQLTIRLDQDLVDWLKAQGKGYQTRLNAIVRQYVEAHRHR